MFMNVAYLNNSTSTVVDNTKPLIVTSCGNYRVKNRSEVVTHRPKGRKDYQLLYIASGKGHFFIHGEEKTVSAGNIIIYLPDQPQEYVYYRADQTDVYWVHFTGNEVEEIFLGMGYQIADGPEVEKAIYNFDKLNTPPDHPARDLQDTFYINEDIVLRSQTSPVQARVMETQKPPIKITCPGTVYRSDSVDSTHSPVFHQIEGLVIDKNISMADLKGTLEMFAKKCLGENTKIRFRPHHFPFTEPSAEADVSCFVCGGKGCRVCKGEGWIELLGCGMVHPNVLENCGIDPKEYSGFAFGFGVERIAMAKFGIDDMRLLYENDVRFLKQFGN